MNNKGQMQGVGLFLGLFVGVIVVLALLSGAIFPDLGTLTNTVNQVNQTFTFPTTTGSIVLNGQAVSNVIVTNTTAGVVISSGNYTIRNYDVSTGTLRSTLSGVSGTEGKFNSSGVKISYTYEPLGYVSDSGSRGFVQILPIFLVLALIGFVVGKLFSDGVLDRFS